MIHSVEITADQIYQRGRVQLLSELYRLNKDYPATVLEHDQNRVDLSGKLGSYDKSKNGSIVFSSSGFNVISSQNQTESCFRVFVRVLQLKCLAIQVEKELEQKAFNEVRFLQSAHWLLLIYKCRKFGFNARFESASVQV